MSTRGEIADAIESVNGGLLPYDARFGEVYADAALAVARQRLGTLPMRLVPDADGANHQMVDVADVWRMLGGDSP